MKSVAHTLVGSVLCLAFTSHTQAGAAPAFAPLPEPESKGGLTPPRLIGFVEAIYPEQALDEAREGTVLLEISVDDQGWVTSVVVIGDADPQLAEAARDAAFEFEFEPALDDGVAIPSVIEFEYHFHLPQPAEPEPTAQPDQEEPSPEPGVIEAEYESVVTATVLGRAATDFTFDSDLLFASPKSSASEILALAPGLMLSQHSGFGKAHRIFLRGFDAVHGQDLEIRVATIPINEPSNIHSSGYADLHFVIPELISSMRVIEGAFDPRQGDFAVAGSVSLELGLETRGLLAKFEGGSFATFEGLVAWGPESMNEETFVAGTFGRSSGFGPNRAWMNGALMAQLSIPVGPIVDLKLLVSTYMARFDSSGVVRVDDLHSGAMGLYDTYDPRQDGLSMRHQLLVGIEGSGSNHEFGISAYVVRRDLTLHHNFTGFTLELEGSIEGDRQGDLTEQLHGFWTIGALAHYRRSFSWLGFTQAIEAGLEFRHDIIEQSQQRLHWVSQAPYVTEIDAAYGITDLALYADLDIQLAWWLKIRAGLRADGLGMNIHDRLAFSSSGDRRSSMGLHLGPKATLEMLPHEMVSVFLSYGNGFRSPHALSLGDGERTPFTTVHAGEVGLRVAQAGIFTVTAAGFVTWVGEDMVFDHASAHNIYTGSTLRTGATLMAWARPWRFLSFAVSGSFTHSVFTDSGNLIPYSPRLVVRADLNAGEVVARIKGREIEVGGGLGARLIGPRPLPYDEWTTTTLMMDLCTFVRFGEFTLGLEITNLFDTRWRDDEFVYISNFDRNAVAPDLVPQRHFTAGAPLTVMGTLEISF